MRLTQKEKASIKETVLSFDREARIYLFGSRADEDKAGGDIDLLIMSTKIGPNFKRKILLKLHEALGEQKIDVIFTKSKDKDPDPFIRLIAQEAKEL